MGDRVRCDGTKLPFRDSSFDFVIAADVIEHISRMSRPVLIREVARSSVKEAHLTFSTFHSSSREVVFFRKMFRVLRVTLNGFSFFDHGRHAPPEIKDVENSAKALGLRIAKVKPYRGVLGLFFLGFRISLLLRFRRRFRFARTVVHLLSIGFYFAEKWLDRSPYVAWYLHLSHAR